MIRISAANHSLSSSNALTFVDIVDASFIRSESKLDLVAVKTVDPYHIQLNIEYTTDLFYNDSHDSYRHSKLSIAVTKLLKMMLEFTIIIKTVKLLNIKLK